MKIRHSLALLLAMPILSPGLAFGQTTPPSPDGSAAPAPAAAPTPAAAPAAAHADSDEKTDLEVRMDHMGRAYRKLKKQVGDPTQNASSLLLVATMQNAAKEALQFTPQKTADLPADQQAKFVEDFKAGIQGMQDEFTKLSDALTAGKNDDAIKIVAEIDALEKKDHKEFRKPKKD
jgi:soluble cytochrome b562